MPSKYRKKAKVCLFCRRTYAGRHKYCTDVCAYEVNKDATCLRSKRERVRGMCKCGKGFTGTARKVYCSDECRNKYYVRKPGQYVPYSELKKKPSYLRSKYVAKHRRRARKLSLPASLTTFQWKDTLAYFDDSCAYCGNPYEHQDHFFPIAHSGGYTKDNIVPACDKCNQSKNDNDPYTWIVDNYGVDVYARVANYLYG